MSVEGTATGTATGRATGTARTSAARISGGGDPSEAPCRRNGVFTFRWQDHRDAFARQGWVHVPQGADPELLRAVHAHMGVASRRRPVTGRGIAGQKDQFVFEPPARIGWTTGLFDVLAPLTGLPRDAMVLSERHVKVYAPDADPEPEAHKDRLSSQIAVGVSVVVPPGSHLVLYPGDHREVNPFISTGLRDSLQPECRPAHILQGSTQIEVHDAPGDVVIFPGSSMWHRRRRGAGTVNLYLKVNILDLDPLGEDPSTADRRSATLAALGGSRTALSRLVPVLGRRFDSVTRRQLRLGWQEVMSADVWGHPPLPLSETDALVLRAVGSGEPWGAVIATVARQAPGVGIAGIEASLHRLAAGGAVDLLGSDLPR